MSREGNEADDTPPRSIADAEEYQGKRSASRHGPLSPAARSRTSELRDLANSPVSYDGRLNIGGGRAGEEADDDGDDADSLEQIGLRSEFGHTLPIVSM